LQLELNIEVTVESDELEKESLDDIVFFL